MSDPAITEPQGKRMLESMVEKDFWGVLTNTIPDWDEMNANQRSALTSFGYNLGAHFYGNPGFNTISAVPSRSRMDKVPSALLRTTSTQDQPLRQEVPPTSCRRRSRLWLA